MPVWLTTSEAAGRLGVKPASLYAYVSRGQVGRHVGPDGRTSRFDAEEIERLARRGRPRRSSRDPMVDVAVASAITTVPTGRANREGHRYRGHSAVRLADTASFEEVAGILIDARPEAIVLPEPGRERVRRASGDPLARLRSAVDRAAQDDPLRGDLHPDAARGTSAAVMAAMVAEVASGDRCPRLVLRDGSHRSGSVAARLATALSGRARPPGWVVEATNAALVLLADHELATSTLAARVAASTRADPYACVVAALATLSGPLHGTASAAVRAALESDDPAERLADQASSGRLPGFGHPLYEGIDPRASALLERVREGAPNHPVLRAADRLARVVERRSGVAANVDLGLAALTAAAGLSAEAGSVIFAVARAAGWLAHVAEEYAEPPLRFRSRAVAVS